jgi:hypothetical protein
MHCKMSLNMCSKFKVLTEHLHGGDEKTVRNLSQDIAVLPLRLDLRIYLIQVRKVTAILFVSVAS